MSDPLETPSQPQVGSDALFPVRDFADRGWMMHVFGSTGTVANDVAKCDGAIRRAPFQRSIRKPKLCPSCFPGNNMDQRPGNPDGSQNSTRGDSGFAASNG